MSVVEREVRRSCDRIGTWLRAHTDGECRVRPAAGEASVDAVEREMGTALPADLVVLWRHEGMPVNCLLPPEYGFELQEPDEAIDTRVIMLGVADQDPRDPMWPDRFTSALLPIAMDGGGDSLLVDLRPGENHGAVFFWDHEEWGLGEPLWPSVAAMLADVADALESGGSALTWHAARGGRHRPCVPIVHSSNEFSGWQMPEPS